MPIDPATIWTSTQLPSLPTVAVRLLELSGCPDTPISDVVATVKTDPAICGRIMKAANSAHVGLRSPVSSIERAVMCLGSNVITSLALSFTLVDQNKAPKALRGIYDSFWLQSLIRASTAELLARELPRADKCELFLSGLLVHVGQLAMIKTIPEEYAPVLQEYQENNQSLCELETARFGFSHVEVGQRLMEGWRLPTALIDAVRLHHAGVDEVLELRQMPQFDVVAATCIAGLVAEHFEGRMHCGVWERLIQYSDQLLAFDDTKLEAFIVAVSEATEDVGKMLDINTDSMLDPGELMSRANSQLSEMALQAHAVSTQALAINAELERTNHELVSQNLELRERIMVDPLTRVYNRSFFDEYLMAEARRCLRQHQPMGLLFCDIDFFKKLNDRCGHQFGDEVLRQVADRLRGSVRSSDIVARYGGEEFVAIVINPSVETLQHVADRMRSSVEAMEVFHEGERVSVTISVGAVYARNLGGDPTAATAVLLAQADDAMYECKRTGRNLTLVREIATPDPSLVTI